MRIRSRSRNLMNNLGINKYATRKDSRFKIPMIIFMSTTVLLIIVLSVLIHNNYDYFVFKSLMSSNYIYPEAMDAVYKDQINETEVENYSKNFDDVVIGVFTAAIREKNNDRYTYLYTPPQYSISKETTKAVANEAEIRELTEETVYVRLPNISFYTRDFIFDNKKVLKEYKNIIVDLQSNHGGDLEALYDISELFLDKGMIIGKEVTKNSIFSMIAQKRISTQPLLVKEIKSKKNAYFNFDNIILLENGETASAAEGFIMSVKENLDNIIVIGTKSYGKGIGQVTIPLKSGYAVKATVLKIETPDGNSIHQTGINPDVVYDNTNSNDIIEFALTQIR